MYLAMTSTSRLTLSPGCLTPRVGAAEVSESTGPSGSLTVCLIPETLRRTTLGVKQPG